VNTVSIAPVEFNDEAVSRFICQPPHGSHKELTLQNRQAGTVRHTLTTLLATDQEQQTALTSAALVGDTKKVRALLKLGADINAQDGQGRTALMFAVINRHTETVKALLHNSADVNTRTDGGDTALSLAASSGDGALTKALLNHRAEARA
jgi:ankyrin repeat protein